MNTPPLLLDTDRFATALPSAGQPYSGQPYSGQPAARQLAADQSPASSSPAADRPLRAHDPDEVAGTGAAHGGGTPELTYRGGRVLDKPGYVSLFDGAYWSSAAGTKERSALERFGAFWVGSDNFRLLKEYGVKAASYVGSQLVSPTKTPSRVSDGDVRKMIESGLTSGAIPRGSAQTVYTVYLPPGAELVAPDGSTSHDGVGGYHMSFDTKDGKRIYYAVVAYSKDDNGIDLTGRPVDNMTITASHEWAEAATDPDVNNGKLGWYDDRYGEVADIVIDLATKAKDIYGTEGGFAVQREWSEHDRRIELSPGHP